jgi:hypothetical protein
MGQNRLGVVAEATGFWVKGHYDLRNVFLWKNMIRIVKSRRIRWVDPAARVSEKKSA